MKQTLLFCISLLLLSGGPLLGQTGTTQSAVPRNGVVFFANIHLWMPGIKEVPKKEAKKQGPPPAPAWVDLRVKVDALGRGRLVEYLSDVAPAYKEILDMRIAGLKWWPALENGAAVESEQTLGLYMDPSYMLKDAAYRADHPEGSSGKMDHYFFPGMEDVSHGKSAYWEAVVEDFKEKEGASIPNVNDFLVIDQEAVLENLGDVKKTIGYPVSARELGISGAVYVKVLVNLEGKVVAFKVIRDGHPILSDAVGSQLMRLKGTPGMKEGKPVFSWLTIPFKFRLLN